jgi:SMC interacting uncharacterized protein involved in chromosome segregation
VNHEVESYVGELHELRSRANSVIQKLTKEIAHLKEENRRLTMLVQEIFDQTGECGGVHNME